MGRPLIAVTAGMEELPTAFGPMDCTKLTAPYTDAIYAAGGQPVIMPVIEEPPTELLARMDGLLLTGGGDLDPALYGEIPDDTVYGVRRDRDEFEIALYREAVALGMPILGICRGMQLINVLRGGNLHQEIPGHWQDNPPTRLSHAIDITAGSVLAETMGPTPSIQVNSYHHQSLKDLGHGLLVSALCGDVIEAVEADDIDLVAVQWHPEHLYATEPEHKALFETFVERAAATIRSKTPEEN